MIIDIDIKIADNNGKPLHHFIKRFDETIEVSVKADKETGIRKEFKDFLAEFLTDSGRVIRDKLILNQTAPMQNQYSSSFWNGDTLTGKEPSSQITDNEMEYNIRIGDRNIINEKISLRRIDRVNKLRKVMNREGMDGVSKSKEDSEVLADNKLKNTYNKSGFNSVRKETAPDSSDKMQKNMLVQAVEKYESNFYTIEVEPENMDA